MVWTRNILLLLPFMGLGPVLADHLGPRYPPPRDLTSDDSLVYDAWTDLGSDLGDYILAKKTPSSLEDPLPLAWNLTFSLGMFSLYDEDSNKDLQFHHISRREAHSKIGTRKLTGDSIYRIQSVTKAITALAANMHFDAKDWERPLTKIFHELANKNVTGAFPYVDWEEVTPIALASQIAGIQTNPPILNAYTPKDLEPFVAAGAPPISPETDPVWSKLQCDIVAPDFCASNNPSKYVQGLAEIPRYFSPWTSPAYSNAGYVLFGQVFEKITKKKVVDVMNEEIFKPLGMTNTHTDGLARSQWHNAVVPSDDATAVNISYSGNMNITKPSGGVISTTNDLAKLGVAILNSTFLPPAVTRKWLKPRTHSARMDFSMGAPWEIVRYTNPDNGVVTDLYTKAGDGGGFSSSLVLVPDFGVGFTILSANPVEVVRPLIASAIGDLMVEKMLPALMKQAAAEAESNLGGTYKASGDLDSTLTLALNKTEGAPPGLIITKFISNGTDQIKVNGGSLPTRLVPVTTEGSQLMMQALSDNDTPKAKGRLLSAFMYQDWINAGGSAYGGIPRPLYVFELDSNGKASSASPIAYRVKLEREGKK